MERILPYALVTLLGLALLGVLAWASFEGLGRIVPTQEFAGVDPFAPPLAVEHDDSLVVYASAVLTLQPWPSDTGFADDGF